MVESWLWDRKIDIKQAKKILSDTKDKKFIDLADLLLSRKNSAREVFRMYLKKKDFVLYWNKIKRNMRRNNWNDPRIEYWQAIYENLSKKIHLPKRIEPVEGLHFDFGNVIGKKIKDARRKKGLTQSQFAKKMGISQQIISRIESGRQNITIGTLNNIAKTLGLELMVELRIKEN